MAKGGHAHSGPAPDPNALRRDRDSSGWTLLPAAGREGEVPEWPLDAQTAREAVLWKREWRRPQALMWERNGQELEVAMYVRSLAAAERLDAAVAARTLVRQQQESLGLSVPGLARNRWAIEAETRQAAPAARPVGRSAKDRFKVVSGGRGAA